MTQRVFRKIRKINRKLAQPSPQQIQRAARAILYPEAGDPLPPKGSLLEQKAHELVAYIAKREAEKEAGHARPR